MRQARHHPTEGSIFFSLHEVILHRAQFMQGGCEFYVRTRKLLGSLRHALLKLGIERTNLVFDATQLGQIHQSHQQQQAFPNPGRARIDPQQAASPLTTDDPGLKCLNTPLFL